VSLGRNYLFVQAMTNGVFESSHYFAFLFGVSRKLHTLPKVISQIWCVFSAYLLSHYICHPSAC